MADNNSAVIWLRFKSGDRQIATSFPLDEMDNLAASRCALMKQQGQLYSFDAITSFAKQLATKVYDEDRFSEFGVIQDTLDREALELLMLLYSYTITFSHLTKQVLDNAIIECVYEEEHGAVAHHVSIPNNVWDEKLLCPSIHMDQFLEAQRKLQSITMSMLVSNMAIVDQIIVNFQRLIEITKSEVGVIAIFMTSVSQDLAPACSLVLGGRIDAAFAIARRNLEVLGTARIIADDKETSGSIWSHAHDDKKSWKTFKNHFNAKKWFPNDWKHIFEVYDDLAKQHHTNPGSLFNRIREVKRDKNYISLAFSSLSFSPDEAHKNVKAFWHVSYIFCMILCGFFDIILKQYSGDQRGELLKLAANAAELTRKTWEEMGDRGSGMS